ncbi:hypothetical protein CPB84DRAFT_1761206 [Gymnopilus junonius]|uniref:F-box domain-containing protein n=1 Tax=Gymnopilus junonius TaxID=109634 RepID=A0A9P5NZK0_GYMJU|nr:hypothetical protein CPB84DRAFT_1761206 [Gymnopilus junonius]
MYGGEDIKSAYLLKRQIVEEEVALHEKKVAALENGLKDLQAQRRGLDEKLNSILPVSQLPLEVLTDIFFLVCDYRKDFGLPGPYRIGRICRSWRQIVQATPRLWTYIYLPISKARQAVQKVLLQEWIERTGNCPLHVVLTRSLDDLFSFDTWDPPKELFSALVATCHRWTELDIIVFPGLLQMLAEKLDVQPLQMTSLTLSAMGCDTPDWTFKLTHQLHTLHLQTGLRKRNIELCWNSLQVLSAGLNVNDCLAILEHCSGLIQCTLEIKRDKELVQHPSEKRFISQLRSMSLTGSTKLIGVVLLYLEAPLLRDLCLLLFPHDYEDDEDEDVFWIESLLEMVECSSFPLIKLSVKQSKAVGVKEYLIAAMLANLQSVQELNLEFQHTVISDMVIKQLDISASSVEERKKCLPYLKSFIYIGGIEFRPDTMIAMLKSRGACTGYGHSLELEPTVKRDTRFVVDITYTNDEWFRDKNPNVWHAFYKEVGLLLPDVELNLTLDHKA